MGEQRAVGCMGRCCAAQLGPKWHKAQATLLGRKRSPMG